MVFILGEFVKLAICITDFFSIVWQNVFKIYFPIKELILAFLVLDVKTGHPSELLWATEIPIFF